MNSGFNPYHKWLGIPLNEQPPSLYRLLGVVEFESDLEVIQFAADRQMAHLQNYKTGQHSDLSQKLLNEITHAKLVLSDPAKREAYNQELKPQAIVENSPAPTPVPQTAQAPTISPFSQPVQQSQFQQASLPPQTPVTWGNTNPQQFPMGNPNPMMNPSLSNEFPVSAPIQQKKETPAWLYPACAVGAVAFVLLVMFVAFLGSDQPLAQPSSSVDSPTEPIPQPIVNQHLEISPSTAPQISEPQVPVIPTSVSSETEAPKEPTETETQVAAIPEKQIKEPEPEIVVEVPLHPKYYHKEILGRHIEPIQCLAVSNNKLYAAFGSRDSELRIWDLEAGKLLHGIEFPREELKHLGFASVQFNETSDTVTAVSNSLSIYRIDVKTGQILEVVHLPKTQAELNDPRFRHTERTRDAIISRDGKKVVIGVNYGFYVWESGSPISKKYQKTREITTFRGMAFTKDEKAFLYTSRNGIVIWSLESKKEDKFYETRYAYSEKLALHPDEKILARGKGGGIRMFDLEKGEDIEEIKTRGVGLNKLSFSKDGFYTITTHIDKALRITNTQTHELHALLLSDLRWLYCHAASPDGEIIICGSSSDKEIEIFRAADTTNLSQEELAKLEPHYGSDAEFTIDLNRFPYEYISQRFSQDGKTFICIDNNALQIRDTETGKLINSVINQNPDSYQSSKPLLIAKGQQIFDFHRDEQEKVFFHLWDVKTGETLRKILTQSENVGALIAISPDEKKLAYYSTIEKTDTTPEQCIYYIFDLETGIVTETQPTIAIDPQSFKFSPNGTELVITTLSKGIFIWKIDQPFTQSKRIDATYRAKHFQFSQDGKRAYFFDKRAYVYDTETYEKMSEIKLPNFDFSKNTASTINADETLLVTCNSDYQVLIFDLKNRKLLKTIDEHRSYLESIDFSPDGTKFLTSSSDDTVKMWDVKKLLGPDWDPQANSGGTNNE